MLKHSEPIVTFRKLVMPKDLNPANSLFGGTLMAWLDEAAAMYAICQTGSENIVTLKVSELLFLEPVKQRDFLVFEASTIKIGRTSLVVHIEVFKKDIKNDNNKIKVCSCDMVFVTVDPETGKPVPHGISKI